MADDSKPAQEVALRPARPVVEHMQALFDSARFEHLQRAATALMHSSLLPPTVRGDSPQQCFSNLILIFEQAERWRLPGTALAQCVSVVHDKLMYEGKAVNAAMEAVLSVRLHFHYVGERGSVGYRIYVWDKDFGTLSAEELEALAPDRYPRGARMIDGTVGDWRTFQKDRTTPNPAWTGAATRNQLAYRGSREWARLYEPGAVLGVYGDDEVDAFEDRRNAAQATVTATAIQTGFSRPATLGDQVAGDPPVTDAEFTDATPADPAEVRDPPVTGAMDPDSDRPRTAEEIKATPDPAPRAARKPAEPKVEPQATAAAADEMGRQGMALEAFEAGHEAGLGGQGGDVPRAWSEFAEAFSDGWNAGAAERLQDATDVGDDGDDEFEPDPEPDPDPFEDFQTGVRELATWGAVRVALNELSRTEAWKAELKTQGAFRVRQARISAGLRLAQLQAEGREPLDVQQTDPVAFRAWMLTVDDADMVQAKWMELVSSAAAGSWTPEQRSALEGVVKQRMVELRA